VLSQAISVVISFFLIKNQGLPFDFSMKDIGFHKNIIKKVTSIGLPIAFQDVLVSVSFLAITAIVNGLGVTISAGVGIAQKLCGFIMLVPSAFGQSMSAFVAQNIGAKRPDRARKALLYAVATSFAVGVAMFYAAFFHGDILSAIFSGEAEVIAYSAEYLKSYAIDCLFVCFLFCATGYFNGCGKTKFVMIQGIIGAFAVRIPVSYLMSKLEPVSVFNVGLATPCSTVVQIILCGIYFMMMLREEKRTTGVF
ncbi:MAG: MATE family efflux transporter, partial [Clostridia bacterium]|nr:MATE family efflux transporter [Clostridia bacterium]